MKLELNKKEYKVLLHVFEMADWVLNSHESKEDTEHKEYSELEQKIFALAQEFGYGSLIEYCKDLERYLPTKKYDDTCSVMGLIEDFENDTFWDEFAERLAARDVIREIGEKTFIALDPVERVNKIEERREKYFNEFDKHGIERIRLE